MFTKLLSKKKQIEDLYAILSAHQDELAAAYKTIDKLNKEIKSATKPAAKKTTAKKATK